MFGSATSISRKLATPIAYSDDGTVPIESAAIYKQSVLTLTVRKKWSQVAMHPLFLNDGRVQTLISRFFLNNTSVNSTGTPWWSVIDGSVNQLK
ncbi:hypothetical protein [Bacillus sp. MUM 116]|uniref:hypothetical protein n=1 Tax=Bacillus sp. MUM 116 TaxID=1678002 RepID=UPI00114D3EF3|nr:hypothetical protein [Bacillus sp. MUM 116]